MVSIYVETSNDKILQKAVIAKFTVYYLFCRMHTKMFLREQAVLHQQKNVG